jgi:hypothetical protein
MTFHQQENQLKVEQVKFQQKKNNFSGKNIIKLNKIDN